EAHLGERIAAGLCVTKEGHGGPLQRFALHEAGHPIPDARSVAAARAVERLFGEATAGEVLLVLLSGGASSLLTHPAPGLDLEDLVGTTDLLLRSGADITELNTVRKHVTRLFGGRLAGLAAGRPVRVLAVSDVPDDRPDVLASGPCAADPTSFRDALRVLAARGLLSLVSPRVRAHLEAGERGEVAETPKPGDPIFASVRSAVLAGNADARRAACVAARAGGMRPVALGEVLVGEARRVGTRLAALACAVRAPQPLCLVAGGETTVTVRGEGRGGRNQELALAAATVLAGRADVVVLAAGTDGSDGPTEAAGAFADGATAGGGMRRGLDLRDHLARNDSHGFFEKAGGLLCTGPTGTNVRDLFLARIEAGGGGE
ncbi:MAG: DUF4147 domain-containing protein, partial [Myxococcota bacterium]